MWLIMSVSATAPPLALAFSPLIQQTAATTLAGPFKPPLEPYATGLPPAPVTGTTPLTGQQHQEEPAGHPFLSPLATPSLTATPTATAPSMPPSMLKDSTLPATRALSDRKSTRLNSSH